MSFIKFLVKELKDPYLQENFLRLNRHFERHNALQDFHFREFTFTETGSALEIPHNLGFQPKDLLVLSKTGDGAVTWLYNQFTKTLVKATVTGTVSAENPTVVRAYIGTHQEG